MNAYMRAKKAQVAKKLMCAHPAAKSGCARMLLLCARTQKVSV